MGHQSCLFYSYLASHTKYLPSLCIYICVSINYMCIWYAYGHTGVPKYLCTRVYLQCVCIVHLYIYKHMPLNFDAIPVPLLVYVDQVGVDGGSQVQA